MNTPTCNPAEELHEILERFGLPEESIGILTENFDLKECGLNSIVLYSKKEFYGSCGEYQMALTIKNKALSGVKDIESILKGSPRETTIIEAEFESTIGGTQHHASNEYNGDIDHFITIIIPFFLNELRDKK